MKVGIFSELSRVGKTTTIISLAHVYARSQRKKVAVFSTGEFTEEINLLGNFDNKNESTSPGVFRAMLEAGYVDGKDMLDYSTKSGKDSVFLFDLYDSSRSVKAMAEFISKTISATDTDLTLVELSGDYYSELNQTVAKSCDVLLYMFNSDIKSIHKAKKFYSNLDRTKSKGFGFVCSQYEDSILSEKSLSSRVGIPTREIVIVPYNPLIIKLINDGYYDKIADKIVYGDSEFANMRSRMLEFMRYLYDGSKRKYIKDIKEWPKSDEI